MVSATEITTSRTGPKPSSAICAVVMRRPSSATPSRSTVRAVNSMPGLQGPSSSARKFIAVPSSSANSITGAP